MNTTSIKAVTKNVGTVIKKNSPTILTALSVAGFVTTTVMAVKATPKALVILNNAEAEKNRINEPKDFDTPYKPITTIEALKLTWKCYVPAALMGGVTIACIIGANQINLRRNAALASVYSLTETAFREYQNKVVETIGENKHRKIKDEIAEEKIKKDPVSNKEVIITGKGDMLCYDVISGRYFKNNIENLRKIQNDFNRNLISEMYVSLNELYDAMGLPGIKVGSDLGWTVDAMIEFEFSSKITENGEPCLVIDYLVGPKENFRDVY